MRKFLFLFLTVLSLIGYSQNTRFGIRSIEHSNGVSTTLSNYYEFGFNLGLGITAEYDHHLFVLSSTIGGEVKFWSSALNQFYNLNIMYGREFLPNNWLVLEVFVGIGFVNFSKENIDTDWMCETNRAINLPVSLNTLFVTGKVFRMGINTNINLNSFEILYSTNLIFQFRFR